MLLNLYSSKTPVAVFSLPLLVGLLAIPIFFNAPEQAFHYLDWQNALDTLIKKESIVHFTVTVLILSTTAHRINGVFNRHSFYSKASFLPGFIYVLGLFSLDLLIFSPVLIAHLFIVIALDQFLKLRRQEPAKKIMFWGAVFIGLSIAFSSFHILLVLLPCISLMIFRPFVWREWMMVLLGGALPLFYYTAIIYLVKGDFDFKIAEPAMNTQLHLDLYQAASYGFFGLIILGSFLKYAGVLRGEVNRFKKQTQVLFHFLWISGTIWGIGYLAYEHVYLSFLIPLSFFIATAFLNSKRNSLMNVVVIIWLIISAANVFIVR